MAVGIVTYVCVCVVCVCVCVCVCVRACVCVCVCRVGGGGGGGREGEKCVRREGGRYKIVCEHVWVLSIASYPSLQ